MLLGARQFFERRGAPAWTNPYVTDGLVAMWDGEWNAGGGVHSDGATTWIDLSGNGNHAVRYGSAPFGDSYASFDLSTYYMTDNDIDLSNGLTIDLCGTQTMTQYDRDFVSWNRSTSERQGFDFYDASGGNLLRLKYGTGSGVGFFGWAYGTRGALATRGSNSVSATSTMGLVMYRNGISRVSYNYNIAISAPSDKKIMIGANKSGNSVGSYMQGQLNRVCIYNRALIAAEIAANYAIDKARFNLP